MLKARKSAICEKIFAVYNKHLLNRKFHALNVNGLDNLRNFTVPRLIFANHSSWWDGLAAFQIGHFLQLESYIMMEEKQLTNLQFFRRLGAFSVVRDNHRAAFESVEYAVNLLENGSHKTLWIFPQGVILPNDTRPFKFFNGLAHIVKKVRTCAVVPLAFRYEFLDNFKPEIFVKIENATIFKDGDLFEKKNLTQTFLVNLTETLDDLKDDIKNKNFSAYQNII